MKIWCIGGEKEIDPSWLRAWSDVYLNVDVEVVKACTWAADNPEKRKKMPRRFLGNWIRRSCPLRPVVRTVQLAPDPKPDVPIDTRRKYLDQMKQLAGGK